MPIVWLIRHGESKSNAGLPTTCPENVALTDLGVEQAVCIAHYLAYEVPPDFIVTSSYQRTIQTAEPTKLCFPDIPLEVWPVQEFTYLSMWHDESSTVDDRRETREVYWQLSDPTFVDGKWSESFVQFIERVRDVIKRIKETEHKAIVIFSHEQFIHALLWLSEGDLEMLDSRTMQHFRDRLMSGKLPNGAIFRTQIDSNQEDWNWELITSHLDERKLAATGVHAQK